jgi:hypothetical protein
MDGKENILPNNSAIFGCVSVAAETCLPSRCLATDVSSGSTIPAFRRHVTILWNGTLNYINFQLLLSLITQAEASEEKTASSLHKVLAESCSNILNVT